MSAPRPQETRIGVLDGWRGIAILIVLLAHFGDWWLDTPSSHRWLDYGTTGVTLFFVLSGYLITSKLLAADLIDLPRFYGRRALRILPAAWVYVAFLWLLSAFTPFKVMTDDVWPSLFFWRNYFPDDQPFRECTIHFWTLSIEEQFYLIWPLALLLLGKRASFVAATGGALAVALFRFTHWSFYDHANWRGHTEVRADALLIGCALACAMQSEHVRSWLGRNGGRLFAVSFLLFICDAFTYRGLVPLHEDILIAIMIAATVSAPNLRASRLLDLQHLKTTGMMSYSIYIWQELFFRPNWGAAAFILLPIAVFASWLLIEQPCIRLGGRLLARRVARPQDHQSCAVFAD